MTKEIDGKPCDFKRGVMKIKFDSDDDLPLNKLLNLPGVTIAFISVFGEDDKYYPQFFLDECLYGL